MKEVSMWTRTLEVMGLSPSLTAACNILFLVKFQVLFPLLYACKLLTGCPPASCGFQFYNVLSTGVSGN